MSFRGGLHKFFLSLFKYLLQFLKKKQDVDLCEYPGRARCSWRLRVCIWSDWLNQQRPRGCRWAFMSLSSLLWTYSATIITVLESLLVPMLADQTPTAVPVNISTSGALWVTTYTYSMVSPSHHSHNLPTPNKLINFPIYLVLHSPLMHRSGRQYWARKLATHSRGYQRIHIRRRRYGFGGLRRMWLFLLDHVIR